MKKTTKLTAILFLVFGIFAANNFAQDSMKQSNTLTKQDDTMMSSKKMATTTKRRATRRHRKVVRRHRASKTAMRKTPAK